MHGTRKRKTAADGVGCSHFIPILSVNEIAFSLGFDYPQYFSRLFKNKTGQTPIEFRNKN
ncbi:helix-turn-helix domain-containing protein [Proteiniphilum sp.]|uniref:helix-turn-helix domain-containing protein n=1 Tax=Proteiniphilum sp. TaxID=1926877 RepID=UPI002B218C33|nr:AraC family transcriptional regulator [Proteiniphilum sp.]MEA4916914.1 AraC family transcriptional regulator [Proteiniphilum sp.]